MWTTDNPAGKHYQGLFYHLFSFSTHSPFLSLSPGLLFSPHGFLPPPKCPSPSPLAEPSSFGSQWPEKGGMFIRSMSRLFKVSYRSCPEPQAWEGPPDWLTSTGESGLGQTCVTEDTHTQAPARLYHSGKEGKGQQSCDGVGYKGKYKLCYWAYSLLHFAFPFYITFKGTET